MKELNLKKVVTKIKLAKIKGRECDRWFLTCGIRKKTRGYKTLIHTFTKRIENKRNYKDNNNNNNNNNKAKIKTKKH